LRRNTKKVTSKLIIVYYYYVETQITFTGVMPIATETFAMTPLSSPSAPRRIALPGDSGECFGRKRIFDRRTCEPEVDTAGGLLSDRSLIHICNVRRGPQHSPGRFRLDCDLQTFGISVAGIGTLAGFIQLLDAAVGCCSMTGEGNRASCHCRLPNFRGLPVEQVRRGAA